MPKTETSPSRNANKSETSLSQYTKPIKARLESKTRLKSDSSSARNSCELSSKGKDFCKGRKRKEPKEPKSPGKSPIIHANLHTFHDETVIKHNQILYS